MGLRRVLSASDAAWIVAGNMVGAGIFVTPGLVAERLPGPAPILLAWLLGGLLSLAGAAVYAELGTRLPLAGGDYQYLNAAFGPVWAFLTGWAAFILTFSAAAAALAIAAMEYLGRAFPALERLPSWAPSLGGASVLLVLAAANTAGARVAGWATAALTAIPVGGLLVLFAAGLLAPSADVAWPQSLAAPGEAWPLALGAVMLPIFFTYTGWNAAAYVAGEIRDPGRNLPKALLGGTALVTLLYVTFNAGLLCALPMEVLAGSTSPGTEAARRLLGPGAERTLSALIAAAIIGSANVTLMAGARVYYAMARDSLAPRFLGTVNRAGVPGAALWIGGVWSAVLAATGTFSRLLSWATLAMLLLSSLAVAAIFVVRRRGSGTSSYACPGYPFTPAAYLAVSLAVVIASAVADPASSLVGLLLVAAGFPVYWLAKRWFGPPARDA
ncbi:MAG: amino acid permease [Acidobacteriota bacterium]